jgi:hypothetical protein
VAKKAPPRPKDPVDESLAYFVDQLVRARIERDMLFAALSRVVGEQEAKARLAEGTVRYLSERAYLGEWAR